MDVLVTWPAYAEGLQRDGTRAVLLHYPRMIHGFVFLSGAIPRGLDAMRDICALIKSEMRG